MRLSRSVGCAVAVLSLLSLGVTAVLTRPAHSYVGAILVVATAWGAAPQAIGAFFGRWARPGPAGLTDPGSVTVVIHVNGQPPEVCRASVSAAAAVAPTVVVATDELAIRAIAGLDIPCFVDETVEQAVNRAAGMIDTDGLLMLSGSSFPDIAAAKRAAGLIRDGAGWVVGRARPFNQDGFAPLVRERLGGRLRTSARSAGLQLWEPNATVVSPRLVREWPFAPGRPWGAWLRSWAAQGVGGAEYDLTIAMTGEPVDARTNWSVSVLRRRRSVAELSDAVVTERGRPRWLAAGLLLRELSGYPLALWLLAPWLVTRTGVAAFRAPLWTVAALVAVPGLLRWFTERYVHRVRVHPLDDMLARAFDAPGSVLALPSALRRRVRPIRWSLPKHPLAAAAIVFAVISVVPLFTHETTARRAATVGLALTELALLWLLAMRAIFQHNWERKTYRIRARLPAKLNGTPATTRDVSPNGLALDGHFGAIPSLTDADIEISLDDGSVLRVTGTVVKYRHQAGTDIVGVSLRFAPADRIHWINQLSTSAATVSRDPLHGMRAVQPVPPRPSSRTVRFARLALGAVIMVVSLAAVTSLVLAVAGYRSLVVRSGSMEPTLRVGDVVVVEDVRAHHLAVGDIATVHDPFGERGTLTHRVVAVAVDRDRVVVTTRGDANVDSETVVLAPDTLVGRVVSRLPRIGAAVAWAGRPWIRWTAGAVGAAAVAATVGRVHHQRRRRRSSGAPQPPVRASAATAGRREDTRVPARS